MRSALVRLAVAGSALSLAACGGAPTATGNADSADAGDGSTTEAQQAYAELSSLTGQERRDELVARAEEEGDLSFYTSMNSEGAEAVVAAFEDTFDIDVALYKASSESVLQKMLQENAAGFTGSDVVETNAAEMSALANEGILAEYQGEQRDALPEDFKFDGWTADRLNVFLPAWNTDLIDSVGGPPTSWEDLADPRFDGQLALELSDYDWYMTLYDYWQEQGKSESEIDQLFADMAEGSKTVKGHAVMVELLSAGQYAVAATPYSFNAIIGKDQGAPVDFMPVVEPVIARPNGVGLVKAAEHPAAAMLFIDWLLDEGQTVLADANLTPVSPPGDDPLSGVETVTVDVEKLVNEGTEWSARYDELLAESEAVE